MKNKINLRSLEIISAQPQKFYDSWNNFILSGDTKIIGKLFARIELFRQIEDIPGLS